ncbi:MAG: flagellar M-ring protein FliF [Spirochaetales bacterium]|nr:flagellar M-ring protein FliF [Spirochaetales bacterium]
MNDFFKRFLEQIKTLWGKWSWNQRLILIGISALVVVGIVVMTVVSAQPSRVALIGVPIKDPNAFSAITAKLDEQNIEYTTTPDGKIYVANNKTARRARAMLFQYDLIPHGIDPWSVFDTQSWTTTDFERDINKQRALTKALEEHIDSIDGIESSSIQLAIPKDSLFKEDQKPVTASVRITPAPGSDITTNRRKIEGIVKLITFAVEGLKPDNVVITDDTGVQLNDFANSAGVDRLDLGKREMEFKHRMEIQYTDTILSALQSIYTPDRVRVVKLDLTLNTDKETSDVETHTPIIMQPANPDLHEPAQVVPSITLSESNRNVDFQGTGFNPEGPPGQEGQTPPAYKDLSNLVGKYTDKSTIQNNVVNTTKDKIEKSPVSIAKVSIGVAIDGTWHKVYNPKTGQLETEPNGSIKRVYTPVSASDLRKAQALLQAAVGYDAARGDLVTVETLPFDRTKQFEKEDADYRAQQNLQRTLMVVIIGLVVLLVAFVVFRLISREMERRRRLREEELSRQHQAMREAALRSAEEEGVDVEMSVAERARLELQETAINMAREHPADVAQLIRTWLAEE